MSKCNSLFQEKEEAKARALAEKRVLAIRGSYDAPGFEACVEAEMENIAQEQQAKGCATMTDIEDKCDTILDMNSPSSAEDLREALGVKPGETIQIMTPQFNRTDGLQVPLPIMDFAKLPTLSEGTLKAIGCSKWDEPDDAGNVLWLFPHEWYDHIPDGTRIISISGEHEFFKHGETDNDRRFGMLAYGFERKEA